MRQTARTASNAIKPLRCAIYTRVSTEHGLDQAFNSLDNQREAAQAYVKSQAHESWTAIRECFDDGGFSGGSLERPALHRLLEAIRARKIDVVVVYKVDRLTRSLADFAKLVELFDAHGVSFVSVTQSFNTTTSMGRLTLNVLLSFAQFERDVTGERIRDKIAASKRKGIWVGGVVPFGYALQDCKLVIDAAEATIVRLIFELYLVHGRLSGLQRALRERNVVTRTRTTAAGVVRGGVALTNGPLQHMLRNRVYRGDLNHKGQSYPGEHDAIIPAELFDAVRERLDHNRVERSSERAKSDALLQGLIRDDRGNRMTPSFAIKKGARYRYYVSCVLAQGRKDQAGSIARVAAHDVETIVIEALADMAPVPTEPQSSDRARIEAWVQRIVVAQNTIEIHLTDAAGSLAAETPIVVAWSAKRQRRQREVIGPSTASGEPSRPIRPEARSRLLRAIAKARGWVEAIVSGEVADIETIATREAVSIRSARMTFSLAFVAPDIVEAAADGILPRGFGLSRLFDLPPSWAEQRSRLGLSARP